MNTKGNQRYYETRRRIEAAFLELLGEKEWNRITISELCKRAQIHRTTFYGHYQDIDDLMRQMVGNMFEAVMQGFSGGGGGFLNLFRYIKEHQDFFVSYFQNFGQRNFPLQVLPKSFEEQYLERLRQVQDISEAELRYHQAFFCEGLAAMIRYWLFRNCRETPEEMCEILHREYAREWGRFGVDREWGGRQES